MSRFLIITILAFSTIGSYAKDTHLIDSLKSLVNISQKDTSTIKMLLEIGDKYKHISRDSSLQYYKLALEISIEINDRKLEADAIIKTGVLYYNMSDFKLSLEHYEKALKIYNEVGYKKGVSNCYNNIGGTYLRQGYFETAITYFHKSLKIREDIGDKKGVAASYNNIGLIYYNQGNYQKAIDNFQLSIRIKEKINDTNGILSGYFNLALIYQGIGEFETAIDYNEQFLELAKKLGNENDMADCYNNLGTIFYEQGKYNEAINYFQKFIKFKEKIGSKREIAVGNINIGNIQFDQGNYKKALEYYKQALGISEEIGDNSGIGNNYLSIGNVYLRQNNIDEALKYYKKALKYKEKSGDKIGLASCNLSLGNIYQEKENYKKASYYYQKAIKMKREIGDKRGIAASLINLSTMNLELKQYELAVKHSREALNIGIEIKTLPIKQDAYLNLSNSYKGLKQYKKALDNLGHYIEVYDSLYSQAKMKEIENLEAKYQNEKKKQQILNQKNELAIQKAENEATAIQLKQEKTIRYSIIIVFVLVLIFVIIIYRSFREKKKANIILALQKSEIEEKNEELNQLIEEVTTQRDEIEIQKHKVEEINFEVSQSIDYAKRIQNSILPDGKIIKKYFSDHFVFFKPRDVVSGDFYWLAEVEGNTIIATADCTGHGVPGAFMSMLGISFLREIVIKEYITHPGVILRKLRKEIINALKQKSELNDTNLDMKMQDGMDMVIISINNETKMMQFAGANNPIYIIKNNGFTEIKGDKMPISIYYKMDKFTTHDIQLDKGDVLYMFSDGYADQFGGEKGKKFKYKPFKKLLTDNANKPMKEQKEILLNVFEDWRGNIEQIDDIVILGVRI